MLFLGFIQFDSTRTQALTTVNTVHTLKKIKKKKPKKHPLALPYCPNLCYAKPTTFFWPYFKNMYYLPWVCTDTSLMLHARPE